MPTPEDIRNVRLLLDTYDEVRLPQLGRSETASRSGPAPSKKVFRPACEHKTIVNVASGTARCQACGKPAQRVWIDAYTGQEVEAPPKRQREVHTSPRRPKRSPSISAQERFNWDRSLPRPYERLRRLLRALETVDNASWSALTSKRRGEDYERGVLWLAERGPWTLPRFLVDEIGGRRSNLKELLQKGWGVRAIAAHLGVSYGRARQLVRRAR